MRHVRPALLLARLLVELSVSIGVCVRVAVMVARNFDGKYTLHLLSASGSRAMDSIKVVRQKPKWCRQCFWTPRRHFDTPMQESASSWKWIWQMVRLLWLC